MSSGGWSADCLPPEQTPDTAILLSDWGEGAVDQLLLLEFVAVRRPCGRAGRLVAGGSREGVPAQEALAEAQSQEWPGTHVLRFILHPHDGRVGCVGLQQRSELLLGERIQLLDAHDCHVLAT